MKIFIAADMQNLIADEVEAITKWVDKYDIEDTVMVISTPMMGNVSHVTAYRAHHFKSYQEPNQPSEDVYEGTQHVPTFIKSAEFYFDDFPWPVGY